MANSYNENNVARLKHLASLATRFKDELSFTFRSAASVNNMLYFYNSKDGTGDAAFSLDLPTAMFLDQTGTAIVEDFTFSKATYPGATNPNLEGKTVLVLAINGTETDSVKYSFIELAKVFGAIAAGDNSLNVDGYTIKVKLSGDSGNLLAIRDDGLFIGSDTSKADKVANATEGHFAALDSDGNLVDSGAAFATDAEIDAMLDNVFSD